MTKKEYYDLLKSNGLMSKTELELTEENKKASNKNKKNNMKVVK